MTVCVCPAPWLPTTPTLALPLPSYPCSATWGPCPVRAGPSRGMDPRLLFSPGCVCLLPYYIHPVGSAQLPRPCPGTALHCVLAVPGGIGGFQRLLPVEPHALWHGGNECPPRLQGPRCHFLGHVHPCVGYQAVSVCTLLYLTSTSPNTLPSLTCLLFVQASSIIVKPLPVPSLCGVLLEWVGAACGVWSACSALLRLLVPGVGGC